MPDLPRLLRLRTVDCCLRCGAPIARHESAVHFHDGTHAHARCATYRRHGARRRRSG